MTRTTQRPDAALPPRRPPRVGGLGGGHLGLRPRRLPPHLARCRRARGRRALRHQQLAAVDLHDRPALRLRRDAAAGRGAARPLRPQADARGRPDAAHRRAVRLRVRRTPSPAALLCRVLLGMGDAMVFISVLRLVALWFSPRRTPMVTQLTGVLGQLGALAAAGPLAAALAPLRVDAVVCRRGVRRRRSAGSRSSSSSRTARTSTTTATSCGCARIARTLRAAWLVPGTRLGLWSHFTSQFSANMFTMLWGFPFLVAGQGLSSSTASVMLMVMVVTTVVSSPVIGTLTHALPLLAQHPRAVDRRRGDRGVDGRAALARAGAAVDARRPRRAHRHRRTRAR